MTCVAYFVPFVLRLGGIVIPAWNFVLFVLWTAVFGIFAKVCTAFHSLITVPKTRVVSLHRVRPVQADGFACRCTSTRTPRATAASGA